MKLNVREIQPQDVTLIVDYWLHSDSIHLEGMGIDLTKMPTRTAFEKMLYEQIETPYEQKKALAVIWEVDGKPTGHSNVNDIQFGKTANMHLHMWQSKLRKKGLGKQLVHKSLAIYFEKLHLKTIFCEPYALNPAPNNALPKVGFSFVKKHVTTPSSLTYEQEVNQWKMTLEMFQNIEKQYV